MNKRNKFGKVSVNCTENNRKNILIDISDLGILLPTYTSGSKVKKRTWWSQGNLDRNSKNCLCISKESSKFT